jgi:hypothetical protein
MNDIVTPTKLDLAVMRGDVRELSPAERVQLVRQLAADAAIAWGATPPVILVTGDAGRLVPYITKAGADQLAAMRGVSVSVAVVDRRTKRVVEATATATLPDGRFNEDIGGADYDPKDPKAYDRARRIAATRARRRAILGLLGTGFAWSEQGDREAGVEDDPE